MNKIILIFILNWGLIIASVPYNFGMGARAASLNGAYTSVKDDPNSQFYNPATLSTTGKSFSYTAMEAEDSLKAPGEIIIEDGGKTNVDEVNYSNPNGNSIVFSFPLSSRLSFGFAGYFPYVKLMETVAMDPYAPQYIMYLTRNTRPIINGNLTYKIYSGTYLGLGCFIAQVLTGTSQVNVTPSSGKPSYATFNMAIKPYPYASMGILLDAIELFKASPTKIFNIGFSYKQASYYETNIKVDSNLEITNSASMKFNAILSAFPFYDPETYSVGMIFGKEKSNLFILDFSREYWSKFKSASIKLDGEFVNTLPELDFKDRNVYRAANELYFAFKYMPLITRMGYAYMPTPVPDQRHDGNLLDCDKHILTAGLGTVIPSKWLPINYPLKVDAFYQHHFLKDRRIEKDSPSNIGYKPGGYVAGGKLFSTGMTLTIDY